MKIQRPSPPLTTKKLWSIARILFHLLKKGFTKRKILADHQMLIKRWKIAGNAMKQIMHHLHQDYSTLACRNSSTDIRMSIVPHRRHEYEFSCSNSPAYASYFRRKQHHYDYQYYRPEHADFVQKVFDVLNKYDVVDIASPLMPLPGFGHSPIVRQLRVTDSPFPVKDADENPQVDKDAEEFIMKFYNDLNRQGRVAALEPLSPYCTWER